MQSTVLQPTCKNIVQSFLDNKIERNNAVIKFVTHLNSIEGNYSIAIDSQWGSGKTFFVKQSIMIIDTLNNNNNSEYKDNRDDINTLLPDELKNAQAKNFAIYFDAWEHDNDKDPLLSLLYTIVTHYGVKIQNDKELLKILTSISDILGFKHVPKLSSLFKNLLGTNILDDFKKKKEVEQKISKFFDTLVKKSSNERIVIFIDELDRCNPSYAVKLLERIKHYMLNDKITFVFSTNLEALSHSIRKYYGAEFDGYGYLEKMFSEITNLPIVNTKQYVNLLGFDKNSATNHALLCFFDKHANSLRYNLKLAKTVDSFICNNSDFNDEHRYSIHINQVWGTLKNEAKIARTKQAIYTFFIPIMILLKSSDAVKYQNFINGNEEDFVKQIISFDTTITEDIKKNPLIPCVQELNLPYLDSLYTIIFKNHNFSGISEQDKKHFEELYAVGEGLKDFILSLVP